MHLLTKQAVPPLPLAAIGLRDKRTDIATCLRALEKEGRLLVDHAGDAFYFDRSSGVVMPMTADSGSFVRYLGSMGITPDKQFLERARDYAAAHGHVSDIHRLSWVDIEANTIYVHSQGAEVFKVTAADIITINNGDHNIYFLAEQGSRPFAKVANQPSAPDYFHDLLLKPLAIAEGPLDVDQARFLLLAWFCSLFLPGLLPVSPLLALVGPASSGKTTFLRCVSELLFGRQCCVVRMPGDKRMFDTVIGGRSVVCLDGVNQWGDWLGERLESIARREPIYVRKGQGYVERHLDCSMAITSRSFPQEGLQCINRLLPISLARPKPMLPELSLVDAVRRNRDIIMSQLLVRLQRLLIDLPRPTPYSGGYMCADFADLACRIARGVGFGDQASASFDHLTAISEAVLTDDQQAIELLRLWMAVPGNESRKVKASELHLELDEFARQRGSGIKMAERPFAHWLSRSASFLRKLFHIDQIKGRSRQQFYVFRRRDDEAKDNEIGS